MPDSSIPVKVEVFGKPGYSLTYMRPLKTLFILIGAAVFFAGCGDETVSRPQLDGEWLLFLRGAERVSEAKSFALQVANGKMDLLEVSSGESVWGGARGYTWRQGKLVLSAVPGESEQSLVVLGASERRLDFAGLYEWERSAFKRFPTDEYLAISRKAQTAQRQELQLATSQPMSKEMSIEAFKGQLKGVWEKARGEAPLAYMGLLVEIGVKQIRGQTFTLAGLPPSNLLGQDQPCVFTVESTEKASIYCAYNDKTHEMDLELKDADTLWAKFQSTEFTLKRKNEGRIEEVAKEFKTTFKRLSENTQMQTGSYNSPQRTN